MSIKSELNCQNNNAKISLGNKSGPCSQNNRAVGTKSVACSSKNVSKNQQIHSSKNNCKICSVAKTKTSNQGIGITAMSAKDTSGYGQLAQQYIRTNNDFRYGLHFDSNFNDYKIGQLPVTIEGDDILVKYGEEEVRYEGTIGLWRLLTQDMSYFHEDYYFDDKDWVIYMAILLGANKPDEEDIEEEDTEEDDYDFSPYSYHAGNVGVSQFNYGNENAVSTSHYENGKMGVSPYYHGGGRNEGVPSFNHGCGNKVATPYSYGGSNKGAFPHNYEAEGLGVSPHYNGGGNKGVYPYHYEAESMGVSPHYNGGGNKGVYPYHYGGENKEVSPYFHEGGNKRVSTYNNACGSQRFTPYNYEGVHPHRDGGGMKGVSPYHYGGENRRISTNNHEFGNQTASPYNSQCGNGGVSAYSYVGVNGGVSPYNQERGYIGVTPYNHERENAGVPPYNYKCRNTVPMNDIYHGGINERMGPNNCEGRNTGVVPYHNNYGGNVGVFNYQYGNQGVSPYYNAGVNEETGIYYNESSHKGVPYSYNNYHEDGRRQFSKFSNQDRNVKIDEDGNRIISKFNNQDNNVEIDNFLILIPLGKKVTGYFSNVLKNSLWKVTSWHLDQVNKVGKSLGIYGRLGGIGAKIYDSIADHIPGVPSSSTLIKFWEWFQCSTCIYLKELDELIRVLISLQSPGSTLYCGFTQSCLLFWIFEHIVVMIGQEDGMEQLIDWTRINKKLIMEANLIHQLKYNLPWGYHHKKNPISSRLHAKIRKNKACAKQVERYDRLKESSENMVEKVKLGMEVVEEIFSHDKIFFERLDVFVKDINTKDLNDALQRGLQLLKKYFK